MAVVNSSITFTIFFLAEKRKNAATRKNYAEEDDYDYDDPFLNDASSDDYQPTDSDSDNSATSAGEDEEDTNRMLKEAKRFTKRRKWTLRTL